VRELNVPENEGEDKDEWVRGNRWGTLTPRTCCRAARRLTQHLPEWLSLNAQDSEYSTTGRTLKKR
jgi:hypothetical protein